MVELRNHISENHRRACRTLGYAWHAGDLSVWLEATPVWVARLTPGERAAAAYSFLRSLQSEDQHAIFTTLFRPQEMPLPPLLDTMVEASDWAFFADPEQRKATALACFNQMDTKDQVAFLTHIGPRRAA